jgi:hypothetical protein
MYTLSSVVIEVMPDENEDERKGGSPPMQGTDVPVNNENFEFRGPRVEPVNPQNNSGNSFEASSYSIPVYSGVDQESKYNEDRDPLLASQQNAGGLENDNSLGEVEQEELARDYANNNRVDDGNVVSDVPLPPTQQARSSVPDVEHHGMGSGWPMFRDGSGQPLRPATDEPLLLLPQLFSSLPNVSGLPMFSNVEYDSYSDDEEEERKEMPITRIPEADHKNGGFGGPGDDGHMLNNFGSRTLEIAESNWRMYDLPKFYRLGDEKFQKLYSHYPQMFLGVYWDVGTERVRLPACVIEAGVAHAIRLEHNREGFALIEVHVRELLFNVRLSADEYKFICQFAPYVIWNSVDNDQSHSLQRFVDGEYWNSKRVYQKFGLIACVASILSVVVGGGVYVYGRKKL